MQQEQPAVQSAEFKAQHHINTNQWYKNSWAGWSTLAGRILSLDKPLYEKERKQGKGPSQRTGKIEGEGARERTMRDENECHDWLPAILDSHYQEGRKAASMQFLCVGDTETTILSYHKRLGNEGLSKSYPFAFTR